MAHNNETRVCVKCGVEKPLTTSFNYRKDVGTYRHDCKDCRSEYRKKRYEDNKSHELEKCKEWRENNKGIIKDRSAEYYEANKEAYRERDRKWKSENKDKLAKWARRRRKTAYHKMRDAHRSLMRRTTDRSKSELGYTKEDLDNHLSSLFQEGMSWDNYGEWEIDHIRPVSSFWKEGITDPKVVNALDNLQPLWKKDNRKKSSLWLTPKDN